MSQARTMLGRADELGAITTVLDRARRGESAALALVGPAGNGKTTLLSEAARRAGVGHPALRVLRARGIESEAEVAFGGLLELVRPLSEQIPRLPEPQARALEGALALAPTTETDRFSVSAATLSLLSLAAADGPILVLIDDLHWVDPPSAQAILFAARRLGSEGVAILVGSRPEAGVAAQLEGITALEVGPLAAEDAAALARSAAGRALSDAEVESLVAGSGGNPLAIVEAARQSSLGDAPLDDAVLPLPVAERIRVGVKRRLDRLGDDDRRALLIAAAAGTRAPVTLIIAALESEGLGLEALDSAEREGVLRLHADLVEFEHPLTRSAAYAVASGGEQRHAHGLLAMAYPEGSAEAAWHLAAAALGRDEKAAAALEEAGRGALMRGAPSTAVRAFARAARLGETDAEPRRLLLAGDAARLAGQPDRARETISAALELCRDPITRADALGLLFQIDAWRAPVATAHSIASEAERLAALDPVRSARMLAEAAAALGRSGSIPEGVELAERAARQVSILGRSDDAVELSLLFTRIEDGRGLEAVDRLIALGQRLLAAAPSAQTLALLQQVAWLETWLEEFDQVEALLEHAVTIGRARAPGALPMALAMRAELGYRRGHWTTALADSAEAAALAGDFGQLHPRGLAMTCQARIEAGLGREAECRATAREAAAIGRELGGEGSPVSAYGAPALGLLELGLGHPAQAVPHLEQLVDTFRAGGIREPGVVLSAGDLVEAYACAGRLADAQALLEEFGGLAELTGRTGARAIAARCRGLLATDDAFEEHFQAAFALHAETDMPFEHARSLLAHAERLCSADRRDAARVQLRAAQAAFARLGAAHWEGRVLDGLRGLGEAVARGADAPAPALTPEELQVAIVTASGVSTPEAGAQLFLSAKTVEAHLERIYRKLGVRSRAELAAHVSRSRVPPLDITSLGGLSIRRHGQPVSEEEMGGPEAMQVLAILLAARRPLASDEVAAQVWPNASGSERTAELGPVAIALSGQLGRQRVVEEGETLAITLGPDDVWDARQLLQLGRDPASKRLSLEATEEALEEFSAPLFPRWPDAVWARPLEEACVEALSRLRGHLAECLLAEGRPAEALVHFAALSEADPAEPAWHRGIMRAHAATGDIALALRQYHACRSALRQVRDEDPDAQTHALYMELLSARSRA